jgi:hypothetical protein
MTDPLVLDAADVDNALALRLSRWQARAARQDDRLMARASATAVVLGCAVLAWLVAAIYLR